MTQIAPDDGENIERRIANTIDPLLPYESTSVNDLTTRVRAQLRSTHHDCVDETIACADAVADRWEQTWTTDRSALVQPLALELSQRGVLEYYPTVLSDLVTGIGYDLPAQPVAAPPYVVVTSTGPLLRATLADGRLLVAFRLFDVERGGECRYVRRGSTHESVVEVTVL